MAQGARFYYVDTPEMDEKATAKFLTPDVREMLNQIADAIEALSDYTQPSLEEVFKNIMADYNLGFGKSPSHCGWRSPAPRSARAF